MFDRDGWNYWTDGRVRVGKAAADSLVLSVDEKRMQATLRDPDGDGDEEWGEVPCRYDVCPTCQGRGRHVNPSVDCDGLTADDFAEDPDFATDYLDGCYDVPCFECDGNRVVVVLDRDAIDPADLERIDRWNAARARDRQEAMWERRMGY